MSDYRDFQYVEAQPRDAARVSCGGFDFDGRGRGPSQGTVNARSVLVDDPLFSLDVDAAGSKLEAVVRGVMTGERGGGGLTVAEFERVVIDRVPAPVAGTSGAGSRSR